MGEIAEAMLDGTLCACCGEYLGKDTGYPVYCAGCDPDFEYDESDDEPVNIQPTKVTCPICGKKVKSNGLTDHQRDVHAQELQIRRSYKT